jgi:CyaY protein
MDDTEFRRKGDAAIEDLKKSLIRAEDRVDMEVEENAGALHISFENPPGRFVITPNAPVRQIWISALVSSFKLDWSEGLQDFVLPKSGERLKDLVSRLIGEQVGEPVILS